jgi:hypothetical protein
MSEIKLEVIASRMGLILKSRQQAQLRDAMVRHPTTGLFNM